MTSSADAPGDAPSGAASVRGGGTLAIVLAAGEGTRMRSTKPKVLHEVASRSMLGHVLAALAGAKADRVAVVVGPGRDDVAAEARRHAPHAEIFVQEERRGTAHAVLAARAALERTPDRVLVSFADTPLVRTEAFLALTAALEGGASAAFLGFEPEDPTGYGRMVEAQGRLLAIREHKDASEAERAVRLCYAGPAALDGRTALAALEAVDANNAQGEFYLTALPEILARDGRATVAVHGQIEDALGVNDRVQLADAEAAMQARLRQQAMRSGVTFIDPLNVTLAADTALEPDVLVEPHVVFGPGVRIASGATIRAFSHLEGASVERGAVIGPFARLRPGARIGVDARVGNFVEVKAARLGAGAKANHLSYLGDAEIGAGANIGAGTITCNYDGFDKARTTIGEGAFIGSNTALVAPVTVGAGAIVGAGSVVTEDVAADALAVARGRQAAKPGWASEFRAAKRAAKTARASKPREG